jgi:hypothetical protein
MNRARRRRSRTLDASRRRNAALCMQGPRSLVQLRWTVGLTALLENSLYCAQRGRRVLPTTLLEA